MLGRILLVACLSAPLPTLAALPNGGTIMQGGDQVGIVVAQNARCKKLKDHIGKLRERHAKTGDEGAKQALMTQIRDLEDQLKQLGCN